MKVNIFLCKTRYEGLSVNGDAPFVWDRMLMDVDLYGICRSDDLLEW